MSINLGTNTAPAIRRSDLIRIVEAASIGLTESSREKWLQVARITRAFATGWFHCDGVGCIARQAKRPNQAFHEHFDALMRHELALNWQYPAICVEVLDDAAL